MVRRKQAQIALEAMMKIYGINYQELAKKAGIPITTLNGMKTREIDRWSITVIRALAKYFKQTPGEFLDYLMGYSQIQGLIVNTSDQTIQGIYVEDRIEFERLLQVLRANAARGYVPTPDDIQYILKNWKNLPEKMIKKIKDDYLQDCIYKLAQYTLPDLNDN